jgi:TatA/E family protein of Tat protein translocase
LFSEDDIPTFAFHGFEALRVRGFGPGSPSFSGYFRAVRNTGSMNALFAMLNPPEILCILALAVLIFGAKKLPEFGRGLGKGIQEFKKSFHGLTDHSDKDDKDGPKPA